jgi:hypothetical protein
LKHFGAREYVGKKINTQVSNKTQLGREMAASESDLHNLNSILGEM